MEGSRCLPTRRAGKILCVSGQGPTQHCEFAAALQLHADILPSTRSRAYVYAGLIPTGSMHP